MPRRPSRLTLLLHITGLPTDKPLCDILLCLGNQEPCLPARTACCCPAWLRGRTVPLHMHTSHETERRAGIPALIRTNQLSLKANRNPHAASLAFYLHVNR